MADPPIDTGNVPNTGYRPPDLGIQDAEDEFNIEVRNMTYRMSFAKDVASQIPDKATNINTSLTGTSCDSLTKGELQAMKEQVQQMREDSLLLYGHLLGVEESLEARMVAAERLEEEKRKAARARVMARRAKNHAFIKDNFILNKFHDKYEPIFSFKEIMATVLPRRAKNSNKEETKKVVAKFVEALAKFQPEVIMMRLVHAIQTKKHSKEIAEVWYVGRFFEDNDNSTYFEWLEKNRLQTQASEKQKFITMVNTWIGTAAINDKLKQSDDQDPAPRGGKAGNPNVIAKSRELDRLHNAFKEKHIKISRSWLKDTLALGELWRACIEPYKGGVWHVLPIFEFFKALNPSFKSPDKIAYAYVEVLFECIKQTPRLHNDLVRICDNMEKWQAENSQMIKLYREVEFSECEVNWTYASRLASHDGIYRGTRLSDFHDCITNFSRCYEKEDFALFIEGLHWPHLITLLTIGLTYYHDGKTMRIDNEFMCLSTGPGHRKDNARLFKMYADMDNSKGGILSALIFNKFENEIGIALFESIKHTNGEDCDIPYIYSTGNNTKDSIWCRLVRSLFPDEDDIDDTIMMRPDVSKCCFNGEVNEIPKQSEESGEEGDQDKQTRYLNLDWVLRVMDMLGFIIADKEMPILSADEKEQLDMSLIGKVMQCLMVRGLTLIANRVAPAS